MQVAPLSRRVAALAIDVLVGLPIFAGVLAAIVFLTPPSTGGDEADLQRMRHVWAQPWMQGLGLVRIVGFRNVRTPGQRLMGIRRVDTRSGGPVSAQSAMVCDWSSFLMRTLLTQLVGAFQQRSEARLQALRPQLKAIQEQHRDDEESRNQALADLYEQHNINPLHSCALGLLAAIAPGLPALWTRRHQTLPERLAGIVVVRHHRQCGLRQQTGASGIDGRSRDRRLLGQRL